MTETIDLLHEARLILEKGEPLPVDIVIKLNNLGVDIAALESNYDL
jgi:hypothetical protein